MGASAAVERRKIITLPSVQRMYERKERIVMLTAHDFPSAHVADQSGVDMILVGDSLAMVALGMEDTSELTLDDMVLHAKSVARGAKGAFTVGDLPMGSYEVTPEQALQSSIRMIKEGRMQAVKLEGGMEMESHIRKITTAGIPVLAHIGLTPQRKNALGGFRVQGKSVEGARKLLADALAVQTAGAFAVVLEAMPPEIAGYITNTLRIPTIGIGAGNSCSGQVLVQIDMSGNSPPGRKLAQFVHKFGDVWGEARKSIEAYKSAVKEGSYPAEKHTYPMSKETYTEFLESVTQTPGQ
ncbi:3-methyl-2-oxobutanoate hydroxymethyltransferase PanB [Piedraia hortae CBS 480.64]|uniref:3-methyl-2-oxobutanoate hydroxymethyltransferase n=1 Tax=Piedraia hortae CBS 480.64 TaxID=1314780 RepID=A0A6A7BTY5_9PEZI|nr:3-methyl-2-oxobutanoate hydroxymethyltransferase PanB [Piedraia hortae CBS 480.64]